MPHWAVVIWFVATTVSATPTKYRGQDLYLSLPVELDLGVENTTVTVQYNNTVFANLTLADFQNISRANRSSYNKVLDTLNVENGTQLDQNPLLIGLKQADTGDEAPAPTNSGFDSNTILSIRLPVEWTRFFEGKFLSFFRS